MTNEKNKTVINRVIKVGIIIGLIFLGLLILLSLIGLILSLCGVCDLLSVSVTVLVAAVGSLLTVLALLLTVKSSNETISLQNKLIALQNETIEMQKAEQESKSISSINIVRNSLILEKVEIHKNLVPNTATHKNEYYPESDLNMRIGLIFSAKNINELSGAALDRFNVFFLNIKCNEMQRFVPDDNKQFQPIIIKDENTFLYDLYINVNNEFYKTLCGYLEKKKGCRLEIAMGLTIKGNDGSTSYWDERNSGYLLFDLATVKENKQIYTFSRCV